MCEGILVAIWNLHKCIGRPSIYLKKFQSKDKFAGLDAFDFEKVGKP